MIMKKMGKYFMDFLTQNSTANVNPTCQETLKYSKDFLYTLSLI